MKKIAVIVLFMLVGVVYADQIPSLKTWVASESYKAADMNANFAKIRSIVNGLLREDNFPSGFTIPASWVAHLTWPSHGSSHAAAGTDPLATDTTYLVGNIAATNATFTNVTAAQVTGTQMTATGITATNATFTTNVNVSGTITGGNVSAINGTFSGDLSAAGNATFSKGIVVTGADDSGYSITVPYPGLNRFGGSVNAEAGNFSSLSATSALYITGNATFTASASLAAAHVASLSADQVRVASLTTNSRLTVGGNLYMSGGGNVVLEGGYLDMASGLITNLATPSTAVQGANKGYVDAAISGGIASVPVLDVQNQMDISSDSATIPTVMIRELGSSTYTMVDYIASYTNPSSVATKTVQVFMPMQYYWYNTDTTAEVIHYYRLRTVLVASGAYRESVDVAIDSSTDYLDLSHFYEIQQDDAGAAPHPAKGFSGRATLIGIVRVPPSGTVGFGLISVATISGYTTTPNGFYYYVPQCGAKIVAW